MKHRKISEKSKKILSISAVVIFILFTLFIGWYVGKPMLEFVQNPTEFRRWVDGYGIISRIVFVGMVALQVIVALIPGEPLELGAGYAFGIIEGTLLCIIGIVLGSLIVFLLVRKFGVPIVEIFFSKEKLQKLKFLQYSKKRNILIFAVFLIPGTPKDLLSYFVGLTDIKFTMWLLITAVARLPSIVTSTVCGNAVGGEKYLFAVIAAAVTGLLSIIGVLIYNKLCERHKSDDTPD